MAWYAHLSDLDEKDKHIVTYTLDKFSQTINNFKQGSDKALTNLRFALIHVPAGATPDKIPDPATYAKHPKVVWLAADASVAQTIAFRRPGEEILIQSESELEEGSSFSSGVQVCLGSKATPDDDPEEFLEDLELLDE